MSNIFTYKDFTDMLKEHAVYDLDLSVFDTYLSQISNDIETLKNFDIEINRLIDLFSNIDKDNIYLNDNYKDGKNFNIDFDIRINSLIDAIKGYYRNIMENNDDIYNKINNEYFSGRELHLRFDIEIENDRFNKFHFPVDLPIFLKNIGLGKKIIMKTVDKFNYCLFTKTDDSIDLKIAIESFRNRNHDYFSFEMNSDLLLFSDNFDIISDTLKKWIKNDSDYICLDKDFYKKYKDKINNDEFLNNLYNNFSKKFNINLID